MRLDKEELTVVDDRYYLHLKENALVGIEYAVYEKDTGVKQQYGIITADQLRAADDPFAKAREIVIRNTGMQGDLIYRVAPKTLNKVQDAKRAWRKEHEGDPPDHSIRFITSHYDEIYRIPDENTIEIHFPGQTIIGRCEYLDEYHFRFNTEVFHICQFAELLESQFAASRPEPISTADHGAWELMGRAYLTVQSCDGGWDYSIYDREFQLKDGGRLEDPAISINDAREAILKMYHMEYRNRTPKDYDRILENVEAVQKTSVLQQLKDTVSEKAAHPAKSKGGDAR